MSQGLLSLLKSKVEREGYLKKAAIAKDKDEQRGNWQDRCNYDICPLRSVSAAYVVWSALP